METVYLDTTIVGHIAGRLHPDAFVAARQRTTRDWWRNHAPHFALYISQLVLDEIGAGDRIAAAGRLAVIDGLDMLATSNEVDALADDLVSGRAIPASEPRDAFHIAIAAINGVQYLLTWNFQHRERFAPQQN